MSLYQAFEAIRNKEVKGRVIFAVLEIINIIFIYFSSMGNNILGMFGVTSVRVGVFIAMLASVKLAVRCSMKE